ncbi:MAG: glycosyltransferase 87 family protein [Chitinophagaceae bacterium]
MLAKPSWIFIALLSTVVFSWSLYRDVQAEKQYAGDLRNRIVGARMQKDGLSPYFYKWKKGDGIRYYDPDNFDSLQVSNITASPFYHHLLYPVVEWPQHTISIFWLIAEYCMLIIMVLLSLQMAGSRQQQWLVVITTCLFLFTEAWKMHIANGQNYICIPLLAMLFYYCISKKTLLMAFMAGCCAVILVLMKPNTVLFFLPFLFAAKKYSRNYIIIFILPVIIAGVWMFTSSKEIFLWKQYKENIAQQIKIHQQELPVTQINEADPAFAMWEGIDKKEIQKQSVLHPLHIFSENGNLFVLVQLVFHKKIPTNALFILSICSAGLFLIAFYIRHRITGFSLISVVLAGFCMYMISDLFSPVYRHQYYAVQWLFPLFVSAAVYHSSQSKMYLLLAAGVVLNILNISFIPMEHSIGEYIMLIGFIVLSLRRKTETI